MFSLLPSSRFIFILEEGGIKVVVEGEVSKGTIGDFRSIMDWSDRSLIIFMFKSVQIVLFSVIYYNAIFIALSLA